MCALNALKKDGWYQVTIAICGSTATLAAKDGAVRSPTERLYDEGVELTACRVRAEEHGGELEVGVEVIYRGEPHDAAAVGLFRIDLPPGRYVVTGRRIRLRTGLPIPEVPPVIKARLSFISIVDIPSAVGTHTPL